MKLSTPFGEICIFADDVLVDYVAKPYVSTVKSLRENPVTACYKIIVSAENRHKISCIIDFRGKNTGSSGERYLFSEFIKDNFILTIGAEDENPYFDTVRLPNGMEYHLKSSVGYVAFTVTWSDNYGGQYDIRTELASDIFSECATTFSDLANFLRHGREIEFEYKNKQYSITNSRSGISAVTPMARVLLCVRFTILMPLLRTRQKLSLMESQLKKSSTDGFIPLMDFILYKRKSSCFKGAFYIICNF